VQQYGSSDSGASLGDILGAALKERGGEWPDRPDRPGKIRSGAAIGAVSRLYRSARGAGMVTQPRSQLAGSNRLYPVGTDYMLSYTGKNSPRRW